MLRVLQAAVVLMGGLLLMMVLGLHQRAKVGALQQILVSEYWSPNGIDDYYRLWLVQPDSGRQAKLATAWEYFNLIGWDADGALIFEVGGNDAEPALLRVKQDGTGLRALSEWTLSRYLVDDAVRLTPDRRSVVVLEASDNHMISVRTDGTGRTVIVLELTDLSHLEWAVSPDSQWVAYSTYNLREDIVWARLDGSETRFVPHDPRGSNPIPPVAWVSMEKGLVVKCHPKLCWFDPKTGYMRRVTTSDDEAIEDYAGVNVEAGLVYITTQIQYDSNRVLHAFDEATGQPRWSLDATSYIDISPNSRWFLHKFDDTHWGLMNAITGQDRRLDFPLIGDVPQLPLWSPDGERLVIVTSDTITRQKEIWRINPVTAEARMIWQSQAAILSIKWSADSDQLFFYTAGNPDRSFNRLTWDGDSLPVANGVRWGDYDFEAAAPIIPTKTLAKSQLLAGGVGLMVLGIIPMVLSHRKARK